MKIGRGGLRRAGEATAVPFRLPRTMESVAPGEVRAGVNRVEWSLMNEGGYAWAAGASAAECLWEFVRLASATSTAEFVDYASRCGVLGLTSDAMPGTSTGRWPEKVEGSEWWFWEPVEAWRAWAVYTKAVLALAGALQAGDTIDPAEVLSGVGIDIDDHGYTEIAEAIEAIEDNMVEPQPEMDAYRETLDFLLSPARLVHDLTAPEWTPHAQAEGVTVASQRMVIGFELTNPWIHLARLMPLVLWGEDRPRLLLAPNEIFEEGDVFPWPTGSLFPILASELVAVVSEGTPIAVCSRCKTLRPTQIRVRADRLVYCPTCRREVELETKRASERKRYQAKKASAVSRLDSQTDSQTDSQVGRR